MSNLINQIIDLTNKMRKLGLVSQAAELENSAFQFKHASKDYDVSGETGEDLVDQAHPEGSHQMKDMQGDSVVETILDRHLKMLQMVNKKPTGKSAQSVLQAVKQVLGQDNSQMEELYQSSLDMLDKFIGVFDRLQQVLNVSDLDYGMPYLQVAKSYLTDREVRRGKNLAGQPNEALEELRDKASPGFFGGVSREQWDNAQPYFSMAKKYADQFAGLIAKLQAAEQHAYDVKVFQEYNQSKEAPAAKPIQLKEIEISESPVFTRAKNLINKLNGFKLVKTVSGNVNASKWLQEEIKEVQNLMNRLSKVSEDQEATIFPILEKELAEKETEVQQFYQDWVA